MTRTRILTLTVGLLIATEAGLAERHPSEKEAFLQQAVITERGQSLPGGDQAYFVTMSDGETTRTALVQTLTPYEYGWFESRDSYRYNLAAYKLDRLIGAAVVPCTVIRRVKGQPASVTAWSSADSRQDNRATVFRALVADSDGTFAGAFAASRAVTGVADQTQLDEEFRVALEGMTRKQLERELGDILTSREIRSLLCRRDQILDRCPTQDRVTGD